MLGRSLPRPLMWLLGALLGLLLVPWLVTGTLANPGLGKPPPGLDLSTPRRSVDYFLTATRDGRFEDAAFALDLQGVAPQHQRRVGAAAARQLRYVLDRKLWLDVQSLSDDSAGNPDDGLHTETLGSVPLGSTQVPIRLQRVSTGAAASWRLSRGTVSAAEALYDEHGPGWLGQHLPEWTQRTSLFQVALWQWAGLLLSLVLSLLLAFAITSLTLKVLRPLAERTVNKLDDALVVRARGPLRWLLTTLLLTLAVEFLKLPAPAAAVLDSSLSALGILGLAWLATRAVYAIADVVEQALTVADPSNEALIRHGQRTRIRVARQAVNGVIFLVAGALLLTQFDMLRKLGVSLLASAGVLTVVVGLAAQKSVGNLIAGIQITTAQPIRIGDRVKIAEDIGWIEEITLTYVTMKTWDGRRRVFPITYFLENHFENWTKTSTQKTAQVLIHADHRLPVTLLREEFMRLLQSIPEWDGDVARLVVFDVTAQSLVLRATASAVDAAAAFEVSAALREGLMDYLRELEGGRYLPRTRIDLPTM
ncbi:MAG: mechanosensitive ion channel [Polyangiaceae bacterium]|nr:mechanosensitive ion channel [Polyangiaceae bacterium]MCW5790047.1 mechanosensitive ion channel [Polyangiaceae bacterium]